MLIKTIDEQVKDTLIRYQYEAGSEDTCLRITMDVLSIVGEGKQLMVSFDEFLKEFMVSYANSETTRKVFVISNSAVFEEETF